MAGAKALRIRAARPDEIDAILALWRTASATPTVTDTPADVARVLARGPGFLLVAIRTERIIGTVICGFDGWRGHLYRLAVHPTERRHGVAQALVGAALRELRRRDVRRVMAIVERDHADAMGFWQASDLELDPRTVRFIRNLTLSPAG